MPPTPPGYGPPIRFHYPVLLLIFLNLVVFVGVVAGLGWLIWHVMGRPETTSIEFGVGDLFAVLAGMFGTIVVHELIHAVVARGLGYRVVFGFKWQLLAPYVAALGQFITRRDNLLIALAPLVILTPVLLLLLGVPVRWVAVAAGAGFVMNTSGAVGDLYLAWRLWRLPRQTLLYDVSIDRMFLFLPAESTIGEDVPSNDVAGE